MWVSSLAIWKGDQVAPSISAASVIAKVTRDRIMNELDVQYPGYGLAKHKGYITAAHTQAIAILEEAQPFEVMITGGDVNIMRVPLELQKLLVRSINSHRKAA